MSAALQKCKASFARKCQMEVPTADVSASPENLLHLVVSNKPHPGLDLLLASSSKIPSVQTRVLGLGSSVPIGHAKKGFGLKLDLLSKELKLCPPLQPVLFTDAWDVILQGSPVGLMEWLHKHPGKVLFAAEKAKWPDKNLFYPIPLHFPFPYLNSGCFFGRAQDLLRLLQAPYTMKTDDQQFYAEQFVHSSNSTIVLDHEAEHFLCLFGASTKDVRVSDGQVWFGKQKPFVLHLNNGATRIKWFVPITRELLGPSYVPRARQIVFRTLLAGLDELPWKHIAIAVLALLLFWVLVKWL